MKLLENKNNKNTLVYMQLLEFEAKEKYHSKLPKPFKKLANSSKQDSNT